MQRKVTVLSYLIHINVEFFFESVKHFIGTFYITRRSKTDLDLILPPWHHGEEIVKSNDTIYLTFRQIQFLSYMTLDFFRKIPEHLLCFVKHLNQHSGFIFYIFNKRVKFFVQLFVFCTNNL